LRFNISVSKEINKEIPKMGYKDRRRNNPHGKYSAALVLPAKIERGEESTLAANRLILVDPRGEISETDLLEFLERCIEPQFWPWLKEKQNE
jgi:hypothetical protein